MQQGFVVSSVPGRSGLRWECPNRSNHRRPAGIPADLGRSEVLRRRTERRRRKAEIRAEIRRGPIKYLFVNPVRRLSRDVKERTVGLVSELARGAAIALAIALAAGVLFLFVKLVMSFLVVFIVLGVILLFTALVIFVLYW